MPDLQEPSGEALRRHQELLRDYEGMMLRGMQAFRGVDPARSSGEAPISVSAQSRRTSRHLQHWEVGVWEHGYCRIDGREVLTFPLVEFREHLGRALIKFTLPRHRLRGSVGRTHLDLWEGEVFGEVLEWRQLDEDCIVCTLYLQLEAFEARSQPGEAVRYTFVVDTTRYRHGEDTYRLQLERAGLLPDRLEALRELMQGQSISMPTADDQRALAEDWHYRLERAGVFEELRQDLRQQRSQPPIKQPAICNGCRYLHGHTYGGTKLVCGMHPYGNGENCSDFEGF